MSSAQLPSFVSVSFWRVLSCSPQCDSVPSCGVDPLRRGKGQRTRGDRLCLATGGQRFGRWGPPPWGRAGPTSPGAESERHRRQPWRPIKDRALPPWRGAPLWVQCPEAPPALRFTHRVTSENSHSGLAAPRQRAGLLTLRMFSRRDPQTQKAPRWSFPALPPSQQGPEEEGARPPQARGCSCSVSVLDKGLNSFVDRVSLASAFPFLVFFLFLLLFLSHFFCFLSSACFSLHLSLSLSTSALLLLLSVHLVSSSSLFGPF